MVLGLAVLKYITLVSSSVEVVVVIYSLVEKFEEVTDSLCVGQTVNSDERVILFLKMADGYQSVHRLKNKKINK